MRRFTPALLEILRGLEADRELDSSDSAKVRMSKFDFVKRSLSEFFSYWYIQPLKVFVKSLPRKILYNQHGYAMRFRQFMENKGEWTLAKMQGKKHDTSTRKLIINAIDDMSFLKGSQPKSKH